MSLPVGNVSCSCLLSKRGLGRSIILSHCCIRPRDPEGQERFVRRISEEVSSKTQFAFGSRDLSSPKKVTCPAPKRSGRRARGGATHRPPAAGNPHPHRVWP